MRKSVSLLSILAFSSLSLSGAGYAQDDHNARLTTIYKYFAPIDIAHITGCKRHDILGDYLNALTDSMAANPNFRKEAGGEVMDYIISQSEREKFIAGYDRATPGDYIFSMCDKNIATALEDLADLKRIIASFKAHAASR
ncbi:hypothetical protein BZL41_01350 [Pseudomonas sp. PIC25]|uniref:hypothetical protein n=1 Tax=Pseudomonas sp. PIC25 TaxID=1958773 RepID=UPI000BABBC66|nr:hypothetical protein [Pseudomonas sp. PIC25]PAU66430.1 hypothetical protein BZL41_01350 [Pseudomonas sp. PIC25]